MENNQSAWLTAIIAGIIGIAISSAIFVFIATKTGSIYGAVAILCGAISGGAVGLGYKLAKGKFKTASDVKIFTWVLALFGLLGVMNAYLAPYVFIAKAAIPLSMYFSLMQFGFMDALFILIGAYGGRWAGSFMAKSIIISQFKQHIEKAQKEQIKKADSKIKK